MVCHCDKLQEMFQLAWSFGHPSSAMAPVSQPPDLPVVASAAFHMWEEHCLECSPPDCYSSCKLFMPRADRKCARFEFGIRANRQFAGLEGYGAEVSFRRWAKLQTPWVLKPKLYPLSVLSSVNRRLRSTEKLVTLTASVLSSVNPRRRLNGALHAYLGSTFESRASDANTTLSDVPDGLQLCFYAPTPEPGALFFELVMDAKVVYRMRIPIQSGWNTSFIPWVQLSVQGPPARFARIWLEGDAERTLVFTHAHLVKLMVHQQPPVDGAELRTKVPKRPADKVKCVVFDLDNTIWDGVIGDDGASGVVVRQEMIRLIQALDERGVICSVASKNDFRVAWSKVRELGLDEYLLFPEIHWKPKPDSVNRIAAAMNISINAIAFVDDNPTERELVQQVLPEVRVYSDREALVMLQRPEFDVPVTAEARQRRQSYRAESTRQAEMAALGIDLDEFIIASQMTMTILSARDHVERCHELIMRTNQFNISGKKYSSEEFKGLIDKDLAVCWRVSDKYGDYGIVGFMRIGPYRDGVAIFDFVMSCRVAEKRNEETIIDSLVRPRFPARPVYFPVTKTGRNRPLVEKLQSMGAVQLSDSASEALFCIASEVKILPRPVIAVKFAL